MASNDEIEFQVDEQYENEKGLFTVVSIHGGEMVIRWENGEEIQTDIELQRNIQARRRWEQARRAEKAKASQKGGAKSAKDSRQPFDGFQSGDFKSNAAGTHWRGRNQLGRPIARKLTTEGFAFNSWAFSNKSEIHWLDSERRKSVGAEVCARFFARLDKNFLMYGFCVPRPKATAGATPDWEAFSEWFTQNENQRLMQTLAAENELAIYDKTRPLLALVPYEDGWRMHDGQEQKAVQKAASFMQAVPDTGAASLEIARKMDKAAAIARGKEIVDDIGVLFLMLMPLYRAAVTRYGAV